MRIVVSARQSLQAAAPLLPRTMHMEGCLNLLHNSYIAREAQKPISVFREALGPSLGRKQTRMC